MVDVTEKKITSRTATASGKIHVNEAVMKAVLEGTVAKGDVLGVARVGGNHGGEADRTPESRCATHFSSRNAAWILRWMKKS